MTGLYRITYLIGTADNQMKISKMLQVDTEEEAVAQVKTKHPTDLIKILSVAQLK